jgi:deoxyribonuclease V
MRVSHIHAWDIRLPEARQLQAELSQNVEVFQSLQTWDVVVGADVSYNRYSNVIFASAVVWRASTGEVLETQSAVRETKFPYQPGFLSFREAPALLIALEQVQTRVDVVMLDGQGIAHPRRMGLATHVGLWLEKPAIGAAKSRLAGKFEEPGPEPGEMSPLMLGDDVVGMVLRTKRRSTPLFVSPGHRIDVASAVSVVQGSLRGYRLPEPTRLAHHEVNTFRRRHRG